MYSILEEQYKTDMIVLMIICMEFVGSHQPSIYRFKSGEDCLVKVEIEPKVIKMQILSSTLIVNTVLN